MLGIGVVSHDVQLDMELLIDGTNKVPGWVTHGIVDRGFPATACVDRESRAIDPCHDGEWSCSVSGVDTIHKQGEESKSSLLPLHPSCKTFWPSFGRFGRSLIPSPSKRMGLNDQRSVQGASNAKAKHDMCQI